MKFSIRDMLLVTVIVAMAVSWWVDRFALSAASVAGAFGVGIKAEVAVQGR